MSCEGCGACCQLMLLHLKGKLEHEWAEKRGCMIGSDFVAFQYPCAYYDKQTARCKIYEKRPELCKAFPVGCNDCLLCRKLMDIKDFTEKQAP